MKNTTKLFWLQIANSVLNGFMFGVGAMMFFGVLYLIFKGNV